MHRFLKERKIKAGYIVCRIDDYATETSTGLRGGFPPGQNYGAKGGYLWPTEEQAISAADHMVRQNPTQLYAVFQLHLIVEEPKAKLSITRVRR